MNPGQFIPPMLATTAEKPFSDPAWRYEVKWDGWRAIVSLTETLCIWSRHGADLLHRFPQLKDLRLDIAKPAVLDGELVAWRDGRPSFEALKSRTPPLLFIAFDCLYDQDGWHLHEPLSTRLERLDHCVVSHTGIVVSDGVNGEGERLFSAVQAGQLEGVMAKRLDSRYHPGRRVDTWQKFLAQAVDTFWAVGAIKKSGIMRLMLTDDRQARRLVGQVAVPRLPPGAPRLNDGDPLLFDHPFAVSIAYRERTRDGHLRHPVFRRYGEFDR